MVHHNGSSTLIAVRDLARATIAGIRSRERRPLPHLREVHPAARAGGRWLGLQAVPTECIRGTASAGSSRGRDFRPLPGREPADWRSRWSRLETAAQQQAILPPIQLLRAGGTYRVVDGHNRVALARTQGQLWIDAEITELDVARRAAAAVA